MNTSHQTHRKTVYIALLASILLALPVFFAHAQDGRSRPADISSQRNEKPEVTPLEKKVNVIEKKIEKKADVMEKKTDVMEKKADVMEKKRDLIEDHRQKASTTKETFKARLELEKKDIEARKETLKNFIEEHKKEREDKKEDLKKRLEEHRAQLTEDYAKRILAFFEKMLERINAAFDRNENFLARIESHLVTFKEKHPDVDTTTIEKLLDEAETLINDGREDLTAAEAKAKEIVGNDKPKEAFAAVRELVHDAVGDVKEAHAKIVEAIRNIKASVPTQNDDDGDDTATSTENGANDEDSSNN